MFLVLVLCLICRIKSSGRDDVLFLDGGDAEYPSQLRAAMDSSNVQLQYLKQFGYVPTQSQVPSSINKFARTDSTEDEMESFVEIDPDTVKLLQLYAGVPQTGVFDYATLDMMVTPRCQVPDILEPESNSLVAFFTGGSTRRTSKRAASSSLGAVSKWEKLDLTFAFDSITPQNPRAADIIESAFSAWAECTKLTFRRVTMTENPDIKVMFASKSHAPPEDCEFDGPSGVKAHAFFPPIGLAHFDEDEDWSQDCILHSVALHEIGHLLGLGHSFKRSSIMFAYFNSQEIERACQGASYRSLSQYDVDNARSLYGGARCESASGGELTSTSPERPDNMEEMTTEFDLPTTTARMERTTEAPPSKSFSHPLETTFPPDVIPDWVQECGEIEDNILNSPGYPEMYPNGMNCSWSVSAANDRVQSITAHFIAFRLEGDGEDCSYDRLTFRFWKDGEMVSSNLCGRQKQSIKFQTTKLNLNFVSDNLIQTAGFKILFTFEEGAPCRKIFQSEQGLIEYPSNDLELEGSECTFHIRSPDESKKVLVVVEDVKEACERFQLLSAEQSTESLLGACTGYPEGGPRHFISPGFSFFVKFKLESSRGRVPAPFSFRYYRFSADSYGNCSLNGARNYNDDFLVAQEWFPRNYFNSVVMSSLYPPNTDCLLHVPRDEEGRDRTITLRHVFLEEDKGCSYDFIEIYTQERGRERFCGNMEEDYTVSSSGLILIYFHSDATVENQGFRVELNYPREKCEVEIPTNPRSGVISGSGVTKFVDGNDNSYCSYLFPVESKYFVCMDVESNRRSCGEGSQVHIGGRLTCGPMSGYIKGGEKIQVENSTGSLVNGFTLRYESLSFWRDGCFKIIHLSLNKVSYSYKAPNSAGTVKCLWILRAEEGHRAIIEFDKVKIGKGCKADVIKVFESTDGCSQGDRVCKKSKATTLDSEESYVYFELRRKSEFKIKVLMEPSTRLLHTTVSSSPPSSSVTPGSTARCPSSHPYPYYYGYRCCSTNREDPSNFGGNTRIRGCRGGRIGPDSTCCKGSSIQCPSNPISCQENDDNEYDDRRGPKKKGHHHDHGKKHRHH